MNKNTKVDKKLLRDDSKYCVNCIKEINSKGECETYDCFFEGRKTTSIQSGANFGLGFDVIDDKHTGVKGHMCDLPIANNPVGFRLKKDDSVQRVLNEGCSTHSFIDWTWDLYRNPLFSKARQENAVIMMVEIYQMIRHDLRGDCFDRRIQSILAVFRDIDVLEGIFLDIDVCLHKYRQDGGQALAYRIGHVAPTLDMLASLARVKELIGERLADMKKIDQEHRGLYKEQERLKKENNLMTNKKIDGKELIGPNTIIGGPSKEKNKTK